MESLVMKPDRHTKENGQFNEPLAAGGDTWHQRRARGADDQRGMEKARLADEASDLGRASAAGGKSKIDHFGVQETTRTAGSWLAVGHICWIDRAHARGPVFFCQRAENVRDMNKRVRSPIDEISKKDAWIFLQSFQAQLE